MTRAHLLPGPGERITALCSGRKENKENTVEQDEAREHAVDQGDQVSRGEGALYTALAEISVARAVMEGPGCGGDCCPLEVETEDSRVELAGAERSIRHALRVPTGSQHRLDVVLEEEA